jgi:hypothetical protein
MDTPVPPPIASLVARWAPRPLTDPSSALVGRCDGSDEGRWEYREMEQGSPIWCKPSAIL